MNRITWIVGVLSVAAGAVGGLGITGCSGSKADALAPPQPILAPYSGGEVAWAVVPPRNESGVSSVDVLMVGDALVAAAEEIRGVRCAPLNRTIEAMRALKMDGLSSPEDARRLAQVMKVDGVLVSTVTAWDPYTPQVGLAVALFARPGALEVRPASLNTGRDFSTQTTELGVVSPSNIDRPLALSSNHFDSRNHQVQADLQTYAAGRMKGPSALGWRSYAASSARFVEFASYRTLESIMQQEWLRVAATQPAVTQKPDNMAAGMVKSNQVVVGQVHTIQPEN